MIIKDKALVIKTMAYRETSLIATFFTQDMGKLKGVMKGVRKDPRKFGSSVDQFSVNDIVVYHYSKSDLHLVSQCDLREYFFSVRKDYKRNLAAHYMLELLDQLLPVEQANTRVYALALHYLSTLEHYKDVDKLVRILQIKMLLHSGFSPHLDACVKCGNKVDERVRFSLASGGLVCQACPTRGQEFTMISKGAVSSILHIERAAWEKALCLGLTQRIRAELKYVLNHFLVFHLGRKIKSEKYL